MTLLEGPGGVKRVSEVALVVTQDALRRSGKIFLRRVPQ